MKFYCIKNYEESITYYSETEYTEEEFYEPLFDEWIEENTDLKILKNDIEISLNKKRLEEKSSVYKELLNYAQ